MGGAGRKALNVALFGPLKQGLLRHLWCHYRRNRRRTNRSSRHRRFRQTTPEGACPNLPFVRFTPAAMVACSLGLWASELSVSCNNCWQSRPIPDVRVCTLIRYVESLNAMQIKPTPNFMRLGLCAINLCITSGYGPSISVLLLSK